MSLNAFLSMIGCLVLANMAASVGRGTDTAIFIAAALIICALPSPPKKKD